MFKFKKVYEIDTSDVDYMGERFHGYRRADGKWVHNLIVKLEFEKWKCGACVSIYIYENGNTSIYHQTLFDHNRNADQIFLTPEQINTINMLADNAVLEPYNCSMAYSIFKEVFLEESEVRERYCKGFINEKSNK